MNQEMIEGFSLAWCFDLRRLFRSRHRILGFLQTLSNPSAVPDRHVIDFVRSRLSFRRGASAESQEVHQESAIRVCLYVAISSTSQNRLMRVSLYRGIKSAMARTLDIFGWFILRRSKIHFHHWEPQTETNKGDIVIRESIKEQIRDAFAEHPVVFRELEWGALHEGLADEINNLCDLFVIAGSGYLFSDKHGALPKRMSGDIIFLQGLRCIKVAYGIGWNTLLDDLPGSTDRTPLSVTSQSILQSLSNTLQLISVRDRPTQELIEKITGHTPSLSGDPALFYRGAATRSGPRIHSKRIQVGINLALHGRIGAERIMRQFPLYCELLRQLARDFSLDFHYVQHSNTERVIPLKLLARGIFVRRHDPPSELLLNVYRGLDIHICEMMHSSILGLNANVPTINIAYDFKNIAFFDLMGLSQFCHLASALDVDAVLESVRCAIREQTVVRKTIMEGKGVLRSESDKFLSSVVSMTLDSLSPLDGNGKES